jgi:type I restriction enzyme, S subunit
MKDNWIKTHVGDVCTVIAGQSPEGTYYNKLGKGAPFYQGKKDFGDKYLEKPTTWTTQTTTKAIKDDILMSVRAPVGPVNISTEDICIGRGLAAIRVGKKIKLDYMFYFFLSIQNEIVGNNGAVFNSINKSQIEQIPIHLPPLDEQHRIVEKLDAAFAAIDQAIANVKLNIKNLDFMLQGLIDKSYVLPIEENEINYLERICEFIIDCEHKTAPTQENGFPSIRTPNIGKGKLLLNNVNRVSEKTYIEWTKRATPKANDLILAREAPAGNVACIPDNTQVCLGQRTVLIRPNKKIILSRFLMYKLLTTTVQNYLLSNSRGATVTHVNVKDIRNLNIGYIPDMEYQKQLIDIADSVNNKIDRLYMLYQHKLDDLTELKQSILQKAFQGELG